MTAIKHIVQFSGGKDSTCMLLMMLEKGMPVDEIIFCDTGMEFPEMYEHIDKVEEYIGRKITRLKADKSYEYYMFDHVKIKGKHKGECGYGWANMRCRWCTKALKQQPTARHLKGQNYISYIGIAYDEPKRHAHIAENVVHPLFDWKVTEKDALRYCYEHGFTWGGLYEHFDRVSCWCCPLMNKKEMTAIYTYYPELWEKLKDMDNRSFNLFKDKGVAYFEGRIKKKLQSK